MELIGFAIMGLLAGLLAKALMPGNKHEPRGCLLTMALGIGGALLVGWLMRSVLNTPGQGGFIASLVGATLGAMLLIWLMRKFVK
jgi:uncharacterized membrane protein YeaQ/YmgE (transglycosylase-associated protein family)